MKSGWVLASAFAGLCAICVPVFADDFIPSEILIQLDPAEAIGSFHARYGTSTLDSLPPLYRVAIPGGMEEEELIDEILADSSVVDADFSWESETPEGARQMVVTAVGETIEGVLAQDVVLRLKLSSIHESVEGAGITVAILDTGLRLDHEMLTGTEVAAGFDFIDRDDDPSEEANGNDDDGDGIVDEGAGHGTMVAGIVRLVAPKATILPIRILDDEGRGSVFDIAMGIRYAVEHGARVINLSLGFNHSSFVIKYEMERAIEEGVAIVPAAGNDAREHPAYFPASYPDAITVAALDSVDVKADFSNWGCRVDLSAPGVAILGPFYDGGYAIGSGSSFAAPIVAGQCALILSFRGDLGVEDLTACARGGVVDISWIDGNRPYDGGLGAGRVDGEATWEHLRSVSGLAGPNSSLAGRFVTFPNPSTAGEGLFLRTARPIGGREPFGMLVDASGRKVADVRLIDLGRNGCLWRIAPEEPLPETGLYFLRVTPGGAEWEGNARIVIQMP